MTTLRFINVSSSHKSTHSAKLVRKKKQQTITFIYIDSVSASTFILHMPKAKAKTKGALVLVNAYRSGGPDDGATAVACRRKSFHFTC